MVTTRLQAGANYFSPQNFNLIEASTFDQSAAPQNEPSLESHHLCAQEIHQAGIEIDEIIKDIESIEDWMRKSYFTDKFPAPYTSKDYLYSITLYFLKCASILSKAFPTFDTASADLSEKSKHCVLAAKDVAIALRNIAPVFSSPTFEKTANADAAIDNKFSENLYAYGVAEVAESINLFLNSVFFMSAYSNTHIGGIGSDSAVFLKKSNNSEFAKNLVAYNELSAIANELNIDFIKSSINLLTSFKKSLPDPQNFHYLYVEISCKALATMPTMINASLAFNNLHSVLIDNQATMPPCFQGSYAAITNQAANAYHSLAEAMTEINKSAFTGNHALKDGSSLILSTKKITLQFNSALDSISNFLAANKYLTESIGKHPYNANISIAFEATNSSASTLFDHLISLQESIKKTVYAVFSVDFQAVINPTAYGQISGTHTTPHAATASARSYASPFIDVESLASTAARITGSAAHAFSLLALHLDALKTENPEELQNYKKFSDLAKSANGAVYKTIKSYQAMEAAAQLAVKTEDSTLENFQQKSLKDYQAANTAITQFRSINYGLFEELKNNIFNEESREQINYARTAGIAASEAFNSLAAHKFFAYPANRIENATRDSPKNLEDGEINDEYSFTDMYAVKKFNHSPLTLSNIKISSRVTTLNSLAATAFDTIKNTYEFLDENANIKNKNKNHPAFKNQIQAISLSIINVKTLCSKLITAYDGGILNSTDVENIHNDNMEKMVGFIGEFIQKYSTIRQTILNMPDQKIVAEFQSIQPACAAFIESFYGLYLYTKEIKIISNLAERNNFSAYEVESSKTPIESTNEKFENMLFTIPISQDEINNDLIDPSKMV